nr:MAG: nonstructural polyprotein [Astroviridae sp.]
MAKFCAPVGTKPLYNKMRETYGGTKEWRDFLNLDSLLIRTTKLAYGYREGTFFKFEGKPINLVQVSENELTEEEQILLRGHAACAERMRAALKLSSSVQTRCMHLQRKLQEVEAELDKYRRKIEVASEEIPIRTVNWRLYGIVAIILAVIFLPVTKADECPRFSGCYVKTGAGSQIDYETFLDLCYSKNTILTTGQVNVDFLKTKCEETLVRVHMGNSSWMSTWCAEQITSKLVYRECEEDFFDYVMKNFQQIDFSTFTLQKLSLGFVVFSLCYERKIWSAVTILMVTYVLKLPLFLVSLFTNILYTPTFLSYLLGLVIPEHHVVFLAMFHWILIVIYTFLAKNAFEVSYGIFNAMMLPVAIYITKLVMFYEIPLEVQIIGFATAISWAFGLKYLNAVITVSEPDGTVVKHKRFDVVKKSLANSFLKIQSAIRGIVPSIPEKSDSIVHVESSVGSGVGFRFMNNIITAGHVVGEDKIVKLTWKTISCNAKVREYKPLFECPENLVFIQLPGELQGIKPLRLSHLNDSDYMSLICFDPSFTSVNQFTGWAGVDGHWISTAFETQPGNSGGPYIDRHGRLVGIHLGTQGIIAQGYKLNDVLNGTLPTSQPQEKPAQEKPIQCQYKSHYIDVDDLSDQILAKLIKGTKVSHAAILTELEKLTTRVAQLEKDNERLEKTNQNLADMLTKALEDTPVFGFEKKKKKLNKSAFSKIKVLTEEQYKEMLEQGWDPSKIKEAVDSLRDSAFMQYEMDFEEYDPEDVIADEIEKEYQLRGESTIKDGVKTQTTMQMVVTQARKIRKKKPFTCAFCNKTFTNWHDRQKCKKSQEKNAAEKKKDEPKNEKKGQ